MEEYLNHEDAEPAAAFLDIAAAFPSVEWPYVHWALCGMGVPEGLVGASSACMALPSCTSFEIGGACRLGHFQSLAAFAKSPLLQELCARCCTTQ